MATQAIRDAWRRGYVRYTATLDFFETTGAGAVFKFFRQYNKVILVVGGCVLMVAFLIPQAVQMFGPNPERETVGQINGQDVKRGQVQYATFELELLRQIFSLAVRIDDPLQWLMLQREAADAGLWASESEVSLALATVGVDDQQLADIAQRAGVTPAGVRQAVRHWLMAEQYTQLVRGGAYQDPAGLSPSPALVRIETLQQMIQQVSQMQQAGNQINPAMLQYAMESAHRAVDGAHRLSVPMLEHFAQDTYARIGGQVALIEPDPQSVEAPGDTAVQQLFDTYRDALPGEGEPLPFGYATPARVKLQWMVVTEEAIRSSVDVPYVDVVEFYRQNKDRLAVDGEEPPAQPTDEMVQQITTLLRRQKASELSQQIAARVRGRFTENVRGFPTEDGYVQLPEDFQPAALSEIASAVQDEFGVEARVEGDAERWVALDELPTLPGIGMARLGSFNGPSFGEYVSQTQVLAEEPAAVRRDLQTQVGVGSLPLVGPQGMYFFRLIDAAPREAPESLDAVRDQVVADARTKAAFEQLSDEADQWRQKVVDGGIESLEGQDRVTVSDLPPFQRMTAMTGEAPPLPTIGRSQTFIDAAFTTAQSIEDPTIDVAELPRDRRVATAALPASNVGPVLAIFLLDEYQPLTRPTYEQTLDQGAPLAASAAIDPSILSVDTVPAYDPISLESLAKRTGFDLEAYQR